MENDGYCYDEELMAFDVADELDELIDDIDANEKIVLITHEDSRVVLISQDQYIDLIKNC